MTGGLIGGGSGRPMAAVVGALGGACAGNPSERSQAKRVCRIGSRYDDEHLGEDSADAADQPVHRCDRVRATDYGIGFLR